MAICTTSLTFQHLSGQSESKLNIYHHLLTSLWPLTVYYCTPNIWNLLQIMSMFIYLHPHSLSPSPYNIAVAVSGWLGCTSPVSDTPNLTHPVYLATCGCKWWTLHDSTPLKNSKFWSAHIYMNLPNPNENIQLSNKPGVYFFISIQETKNLQIKDERGGVRCHPVHLSTCTFDNATPR